jgi:hypothetical protein
MIEQYQQYRLYGGVLDWWAWRNRVWNTTGS